MNDITHNVLTWRKKYFKKIKYFKFKLNMLDGMEVIFCGNSDFYKLLFEKTRVSKKFVENISYLKIKQMNFL